MKRRASSYDVMYCSDNDNDNERLRTTDTNNNNTNNTNNNNTTNSNTSNNTIITNTSNNNNNNNNNSNNNNSNTNGCYYNINWCCSQPPSSACTTGSSKRHKSYSNKLGNYIIGPRLHTGFSIASITQYLCKKEKTQNFYILKVLNNNINNYDVCLRGKMLLHNEYTLLSMLQYEDGVIHHHGLFKEYNCINGETDRSEKLCLVLDCYVRHEFDSLHQFTNLQHYICKQKYLPEREALTLFYKIFKIIENVHKKNIVHRDLKLGNIIYDLQTQKVYLINFSLGRQLLDDNEKLNEQLGSPAYISPDVLSNKPYYGKPNDVWSLGVILYTMLYGQFPFYDPSPERLFKKIQSAEFTLPTNIKVSEGTKNLLKNILQIDPLKRLNATQILDATITIISNYIWKALRIDSNSQIVPEYGCVNDDNCKTKTNTQTKNNEDNNTTSATATTTTRYNNSSNRSCQKQQNEELVFNLKNLNCGENNERQSAITITTTTQATPPVILPANSYKYIAPTTDNTNNSTTTTTATTTTTNALTRPYFFLTKS